LRGDLLPALGHQANTEALNVRHGSHRSWSSSRRA
jgi:hypothetical protein